MFFVFNSAQVIHAHAESANNDLQNCEMLFDIPNIISCNVIIALISQQFDLEVPLKYH